MSQAGVSQSLRPPGSLCEVLGQDHLQAPTTVASTSWSLNTCLNFYSTVPLCQGPLWSLAQPMWPFSGALHKMNA